MLGEDGVAIGADRIKSDVAEVKQPGIADDDVQTQTEHDVNQRQGGDIDRTARAENRHEKGGDDEQRQHDAAVVFNIGGGAETRVARQTVLRLNGKRQQELRDEDDRCGVETMLPLAGERQPLRALIEMNAENRQGDEESQRRGEGGIKQVAHHTFSTSGLPRMPEGRMSSTTISREKATKSLYSLAR